MSFKSFFHIIVSFGFGWPCAMLFVGRQITLVASLGLIQVNIGIWNARKESRAVGIMDSDGAYYWIGWLPEGWMSGQKLLVRIRKATPMPRWRME